MMVSAGMKYKRSPLPSSEVSHNLLGQRLGRKGQETREKILTAALRLLEDPDGPPVTLSSVAREASVKLTNLYLYFPDFGDLVLATLRRVVETADSAYLDLLSVRWPDEQLGDYCLAATRAYYRFWKAHARLLHLRNTLSETDQRILAYRQEATNPVIEGLKRQMGGTDAGNMVADMAAVVLTGLERIATITTNPNFHSMARDHGDRGDDEFIDRLLAAQARLVELAIRDQRSASASVQ